MRLIITDDVKERICMRYCNTNLTEPEHDACLNTISLSSHTKLTVLPNHGLNNDGELQGFMFSAHPDDSASILPINKNMCSTCKDIHNLKTSFVSGAR